MIDARSQPRNIYEFMTLTFEDPAENNCMAEESEKRETVIGHYDHMTADPKSALGWFYRRLFHRSAILIIPDSVLFLRKSWSCRS